MKDIINQKSQTEDGRRDLPGTGWTEINHWINETVRSNPNIIVRYY
jgi:hypothetical protein